MGQFASRAFDGDPYIEIMRALPDKEMSWWVQKVLWAAEGYVFMEHFGRTYPTIFMHKCQHCKGAGTVTCPHCNGYKVKRANPHTFRLSEQTTVGKLLADANTNECDHCGGFCAWDAESEWQDKWDEWESRIQYYDRTYGALMDEWYEDVIHEGRLDEDTQPEDDDLPGLGDNSDFAKVRRETAKDAQRLKALMKRYDGHPYENGDILHYKVLDPKKPLAENIEALGISGLDLPPELNPEVFPQLLLMGADSPLAKFEEEIRMEYLIMNNLEAAMRDLPKPATFTPTAGTVACPSCKGQAWGYSWLPNLGKLMGTEPPMWLSTLASMAPGWQHYSLQEGHPHYSPYLSPAAAAAASAAGLGPRGGNSSSGSDGASTSSGAGSCPEGCNHPHHHHHHHGAYGQRRWKGQGEVPTLPPLLTAAQQAAVAADLKADPEKSRALKERLYGYGAVLANQVESLPGAPSYLNDYNKRVVPDDADVAAFRAAIARVRSAQAEASRGTSSGSSKGYGARDPLSHDAYAAALNTEELEQAVLSAGKSPLTGNPAFPEKWLAADVANPARIAARQIRDARQLGKASTAEEQEVALKWAEQQSSLKGSA